MKQLFEIIIFYKIIIFKFKFDHLSSLKPKHFYLKIHICIDIIHRVYLSTKNK